MMTSEELREFYLEAHLKAILDMVPEKDNLFKIEGKALVYKGILERLLDPPEDFQLVLLQLAKKNETIYDTMTREARVWLQGPSTPICKSARIFISDLLITPRPKPSKRNILVRDVLIIIAIMILRELGKTPTKSPGTYSDEKSGCETGPVAV